MPSRYSSSFPNWHKQRLARVRLLHRPAGVISIAHANMTTFAKHGGLLLVFLVFCLCAHLSMSSVEAGRRGKQHHRHRRDGKHKHGKPFRGARVRRPEYHGSGCPPSSLSLVNSSDETSFAMSIMFSDFQVQTSETKLRDHKKCFINVELAVEPVRDACT